MLCLVVLNYILVGCPWCSLSFKSQIKKNWQKTRKPVTPARLVPVFHNEHCFPITKNRHCCFEVVNVFSLALVTGIMRLELTWALRMTRDLLVKYRCKSCYIKFIPCLPSTLQALINPPANIPESRYSPNSGHKRTTRGHKRVGLILYLYTGYCKNIK